MTFKYFNYLFNYPNAHIVQYNKFKGLILAVWIILENKVQILEKVVDMELDVAIINIDKDMYLLHLM